VPLAHARHFHGDPTAGRRLEQATNRIVTPHSQFEEVRTQLRAVQRRLEQAQASAAEPQVATPRPGAATVWVRSTTPVSVVTGFRNCAHDELTDGRAFRFA